MVISIDTEKELDEIHNSPMIKKNKISKSLIKGKFLNLMMEIYENLASCKCANTSMKDIKYFVQKLG